MRKTTVNITDGVPFDHRNNSLDILQFYIANFKEFQSKRSDLGLW